MANERHSYVEFYPSDWMGGTSFMPPMVEWLYLQICLYNWDKREPIPKAESLMRFSRSPSWESDLALLIDAGKVVKTQGGGLFVPRAIASANKSYDLWLRKSKGGKARQTKDNNQSSPNMTLDESPTSTLPANQNQNQNQNHKDSPNGESSARVGDLVFEVPADAMQAFRDHRVKIKAPMTLRAEQLIIGKLEKIQAEHGHDPAKVLDQSILKGWRDIFPLKRDSSDDPANRQGSGEPRDTRDGFQRAIDGKLGRA